MRASRWWRLREGGCYSPLTLTRAHHSDKARHFFIFFCYCGVERRWGVVDGVVDGVAGCISVTGQAKWGGFHDRVTSLWDDSPSFFFLFFRHCLTVRVSSDCAPRCRRLSSGQCRPQPSRRFCLGRAPPSESPGEQQQCAPSVFYSSPLKTSKYSCYTHAFQPRPPQRDLGVPPAVPTRPSPHCWTVLLSFLHKHLQHAHVVARQLVPEGQAQIAVVPGGREWEDQLGSSPRPFVAHLRDGEVSSTCCDGDWDQLLEK